MSSSPSTELASPEAAAPGVRRRAQLRSRVVGQTAVYTLASGGSMALSGVAAAILAHEMAPASFGSYSFARSFIMLAALVFDFGLFIAAARQIARSDGSRQREIVGAALIALLPIGVAFGVAMFGLSFAVDHVFNTSAHMALLVCAPLAIGWTFAHIAETVAKGYDRLHVFSISQLGARIVLVASLVGFLVADHGMSPALALLLESISLLIALAMFAIWLRPVFRRVREHIRGLVREVRAWAFQVYIGGFLSIGTYNMDVLMVASFSDAKSIGFYSLAGALTAALGLPMMGFGAALYPRMVKQDRLDGRWLAVAWAWGGAGIVLIAVGAPAFVALVFSDEYATAATLAIPLAIAQAVRGVTTIYVNFMSAQGQGRYMRNAALTLTISNILFNFALIPPYGAKGAAWASLLALSVNYLAYVLLYRRHVRALPAVAA